ncbi:MAG TPA: hypothetical protein DCL38_09600 [Lachnospiraceae bacterium]|nr:hypothetical protein [Lachnospiraceae bacterium]
MSKKIPQEEYKKTFSYKYFRWLGDEDDAYIGRVEMSVKTPHEEEVAAIRERMSEKELMFDRIYDLENNKLILLFRRIYKAIAVLFCLTLFLLLLVNVSYLPPIGDPDNPADNEVPRRYIESGLQETGAINIVSGMILDYRAFDTFGESNVLFIATVTVLILLKIDSTLKRRDPEKYEEETNDRRLEPKNDLILQGGARVLIPVIFLWGVCVILNGHLSPGGGFSGGAIIGAGLILYLNAFGFKRTERFFVERTYKLISFVALTFYCLAKSYSFFTGANHLESHIPKGEPGAILSGGLIFPLDICVGFVVACTMYTFYCMFRKGDF